ncbi:wd40 repeat-like protein [Ceraceosorus bombacis]|uniref:Wd40 repeat-like protein n=1 Tax=Ceraceosorus bombacis TaxID=401625 RepID=A0A0N7LAT4_9BASI|nr:wd40 repeat-like protein [Ceraceosorus bombacis]
MSAPASPPLVGGEPGAPTGGHPHTISPPTPAPSPQPSGLSRLATSSASSASAALISALPTEGATLRKYISLIFPSLISSDRLQVLSELLALCSLRELAQLQSDISPRLKVDFLGALPIELSLHVLGFIDDPRTLARASAVSRFWRSLVNDEHTWKAMCSKYAFRLRRTSMSASQSAPFLHHQPAFGLSPLHPAASASRLGYPRGMSRASFSDEDVVEEDAVMEEEDEHLDDGQILSSLYERYRARGLDPSNALHELRTLHDLFLAKQADGSIAGGTNSSSDALGVGLAKAGRGSLDMSEADRMFYRQLEEIVAEESRERYGEEVVDGADDDAYEQPRSLHAGPSSDSSRVLGETSSRTPEAGNATTPGNWGWLSAGSFANLPGSRMLPSWPASRTPREGSAVTAGLGALTSPARDRASLPQVGEYGTAPPESAHRPADGYGEGDVEMSDNTEEASVAAHVARSSARRDRDPLHASPSNTTTSAPRRRSGDAQGKRMKRRSAPGQAHAASASDVFQDASSSSAKAATPSFALGRPSWMSGSNAKSNRAATYAEGLPEAQSRSTPFSYKTHFKLAYLTESNWRKGGRLLTRYTSTEGGAVVTSLAVDKEWIVVGMANAKIHVFDAQTGLYARTLIGHETGVWALTLVSSTGGSQARLSEGNGKGKLDAARLARADAGAASGGDLELVEHDLRPSASSYDDEALMYGGNLDASARSTWSSTSDAPLRAPSLVSRSSAAKAVPSRTQSSSGLYTVSSNDSTSGEDETLEWFHRARRAMLRKATSSSNLNLGAVAGDGANASAASSTLRGGPISAPAAAASLNAATGSARDFARAQAEAEADAGNVRDAVMTASSGAGGGIPTHITDQLDASHFSFFGDSDAGDAPSAWANSRSPMGAAGFVAPSGGNHRASGGGRPFSNANPCGSVKGYGNRDALVVTGGCDRDVRVWNLRTGVCEHIMSGHGSTVRCLKVIEGRPLAVSGSRDSTVRVWNIQTGKLVHQLSGHQHSVRCVEVAGNRIASGSYDCMCRVWDVDTGECINVLRGHFHQIYAIAFDGVRVATGSLDSTVRIWSASTGECLCVLQGHTSLVGQLQLTDSTLITGGSDGRVIVFCLDTFTTKARLCAHDNSVTCLQFNDRFIVTGGNDGRVKLWDFATGQYIREMVEPAEAIWKMTFRNDCCIILCRRNGRTSMETISFRPLLDS